MSAAEERGSPVLFRGVPHRLSAVVPDLAGPLETLVEVELPLPQLQGPGEAAQQAASPAPVSVPAWTGRMGELRFALPRETPPGVYEGVIRIGEREQPVRVEVEPRVRLRMVPRGLHIAGGPGERVNADLALFNEGNAPAEIRKAYAFWLFDVRGADRVIDRFFHEDVQAEVREGRFNRLIDAANEQFGGRVRVQTHRGAGRIAPGETREFRATFILPARLRSGQTYSGTWHLHNLSWPLRVTASGEAQPQGEEEEATP